MYRTLIKLTPRQLARKVPRAVRRRVARGSERVLDRMMSTRAEPPENGGLRRILADMSGCVPPEQREALAGVTANYLQGRFSLLGSGWLSWHYGSPPPGREGHRFDPGPSLQTDPRGDWIEGKVTAKNLPASRKLWALVDQPYQPLDWQLDARSGARWDATVHALDTPIGRRKGADIKLPWELSKMHHLPRLALAYGQSRNGVAGFVLASEYVRAFQNQICDFLALNPPRFGANWATAMLAGIRLANILVAYDLFRAAGATFAPDFDRALIQTTREHVSFILRHLDWWDLDQRNNHYLANLAGLAFAGSYLPDSPLAATVQSFAVHELAGELDFQFNPDGSHFEGSTAYHAFSAEMVGWALAILVASYSPATPIRPGLIPREARRRAFGAGTEPEAPRYLMDRLAEPLQFLKDVQRPGSRLLQIGDNDSGRFLKLDVLATRTELSVIRRRFLNLRELPESAGAYWDEHELDYAPTQGLLGALTGSESTTPTLSYVLAQSLIEGFGPGSGAVRIPEAPATPSLDSVLNPLLAGSGTRLVTQRFVPEDAGSDLREGLTVTRYDDFGLILFRSPRLWLSVRVAGARRADGGHNHTDSLSFELHLDGKAWRVDPGAYVYTSLPWRRNQFRSAGAHSIPRLREEDFFGDETGVFAPASMDRGTLLSCTPEGLVGERLTPYGPVYRVIRLHADHVEVTDLSHSGQPVHVEPLPWWSPGYGRLVAFEAGERLEGAWLARRHRSLPRGVEDRPVLPSDPTRRDGPSVPKSA